MLVYFQADFLIILEYILLEITREHVTAVSHFLDVLRTIGKAKVFSREEGNIEGNKFYWDRKKSCAFPASCSSWNAKNKDRRGVCFSQPFVERRRGESREMIIR